MEVREIYFPKRYLEQIKAEATEELKEMEAAGQREFVGSSDLLVAIALKAMCAQHVRGPDDKRPVSFMYPANLRWLPGAKEVVPLPEPYLHNGTLGVSLPEQLIGELVHELTVTELALELRRALKRDTQPEAIRRTLTWRLTNAHKFLFFARPSNLWISGTNWRKMDFFKLPFAEAVDRQSPQPPTAASGRVVKVWTNVISAAPVRNIFTLVSDDAAGGVWAIMTLSSSQWANVVL